MRAVTILTVAGMAICGAPNLLRADIPVEQQAKKKPNPAAAQQPAGPAIDNSLVQDYGQMFSPAARAAAAKRLADVKTQTGRTMLVRTVAKFEGETSGQAADRMILAEKMNGLFVLLSKVDRRLETRSSNRMRAELPIHRLRTIKDGFIANFKANDYDAGLKAAVAAFAAAVGSEPLPAGHAAAADGTESSNPIWQWLALCGTAIAVFGGGYLLTHFRRKPS